MRFKSILAYLITLSWLTASSTAQADQQKLAQHTCTESGQKVNYTVVFKKASLFGDVFVVDGNGKRHLRFEHACGPDQSSIDLINQDNIVMEYVRHAGVGLVYAKQHRSALVIGMGGGVFSNLLANHIPDIEIDAVEIDPVVVEAAERFFGVVPGNKHRIHTVDGEAFVDQADKRYDIILLDAYDSDGIVPHLATNEFFNKTARLLSPGGVIVANFGLDTPRVYLKLAERLQLATGAGRCLHGIEESNLVVIAASPETIGHTDLESRSDLLDKALTLPFSLSQPAKRIKPCPVL